MDKPAWADYVRPDEIAETWDGVYRNAAVPDLYEQLWGLMVEVAEAPNKEDSGPADHVGHGNIGDFWDKLPEAVHAELVRLDGEQIWNRERT